MNNSDSYIVCCQNKTQLEAAIQYLFKIGYCYSAWRKCTSLSEVEKAFPLYLHWGRLKVDSKTGTIEASSISILNNEKGYDLFAIPPIPTEITVELNEKYKAIINKNTVTVGCQTFDAEVIDKLYEARKKLKS